MNRNALHIVSRLTIIVAALALVLGTFGCADLLAPKKDFYGTIKNMTEWLLYVPNPANVSEVHELSPGVYFSCTLEGSRVYHFQASLPDGTIYASFDARINNVSGDASINGVNVDWMWVIGGPFQACVTPIGGGDAAAYQVTIENYTSLDPNLRQLEVKMYRDPSQMMKAVIDFERTHPVSSQGHLFPGHEKNVNIFAGRANVVRGQ